MRAWEELETRRIQIAADREIARSEWQEAASVQGVISERRRLLEQRVVRIEADLARFDGDDPHRWQSNGSTWSIVTPAVPSTSSRAGWRFCGSVRPVSAPRTKAPSPSCRRLAQQAETGLRRRGTGEGCLAPGAAHRVASHEGERHRGRAS